MSQYFGDEVRGTPNITLQNWSRVGGFQMTELPCKRNPENRKFWAVTWIRIPGHYFTGHNKQFEN
jgi:hypothetical protein